MHKICRKCAIKYSEQYARNITNMQRNITNMQCGSIMENMQENMKNMQNPRTMPKICKICQIFAPNVRKGLLSRGHPLYQYPIFSTCPEILDLNRMHLSRSSSFQTFGLLFTDAAHTVIDRFLRLEGRVGPYGLAWHNEFEWPISRSLLSQFCGTQEALVNAVRARYETTKLHITFIAAGLPIP